MSQSVLRWHRRRFLLYSCMTLILFAGIGGALGGLLLRWPKATWLSYNQSTVQGMLYDRSVFVSSVWHGINHITHVDVKDGTQSNEIKLVPTDNWRNTQWMGIADRGSLTVYEGYPIPTLAKEDEAPHAYLTFDSLTGKELSRFDYPAKLYSAMGTCPHRPIGVQVLQDLTTQWTKLIRWDLRSGKEISSFDARWPMVNVSQVSPSGRYVTLVLNYTEKQKEAAPVWILFDMDGNRELLRFSTVATNLMTGEMNLRARLEREVSFSDDEMILHLWTKEVVDAAGQTRLGFPWTQKGSITRYARTDDNYKPDDRSIDLQLPGGFVGTYYYTAEVSRLAPWRREVQEFFKLPTRFLELNLYQLQTGRHVQKLTLSDGLGNFPRRRFLSISDGSRIITGGLRAWDVPGFYGDSYLVLGLSIGAAVSLPIILLLYWRWRKTTRLLRMLFDEG